MHVRNLVLTAATAAADFIVITKYPTGLSTLDSQQQASYLASVLPNLQSQFLSLATDTSYLARATSVVPQMREFVETATVSIPPVVTATDDIQIFTTVPAWYSQLPSGVRALYDEVGSKIEDALNDVQPTGAVNASQSVSVTPSLSSSVSRSATGNVTLPVASPTGSQPPESTGGAGRVGVGMGAGVLVGVVGLVVL
ncbi:hypothetical protein FB567DRAFT_606465 [Paraphoma chrysanthemicola]|uniref:Uncharacterized protein n=1 Tax=Paraphoma chrysanthemicola TaxID=798071 RepID=A0A8K0VVI7_9PLEO|nr:hypothetical protein FB567DRAFT_606465 [Paraphoma chrysanthemicola]